MTQKTSTKAQPAARKAAKGRSRPAARRAAVKRPTSAPADMTKQAKLIALLRAERGTTIADAATALTWQQHSIRGLMSGVLKKKLKLAIEKLPDVGSGTRYRITG